MLKVNKLAVLIAGDFRFWPKAAEYIFDFADGKADHVDYYFATWNTTRDFWYPTSKSKNSLRSVTEKDITEKFQQANKNLIDFKLLDLITLPGTSFYYQAYLGYAAALLKRRYELDNKFIYDQVIELRPDLFIAGSNEDQFKDFEIRLHVTHRPLSHAGFTRHFPVAHDLWYQTNSFTNDIMSLRYFYDKAKKTYTFPKSGYKHWPCIIDNHWMLFDYVYLRRLIPLFFVYENREPIKDIPIRSNFPEEDLRTVPLEKLQQLEQDFLNAQGPKQDDH